MRILVLGAGFGGLELTTQLSDELGDDVEIVLIDKAEGFVFGFSKLDVMFGRTVADAVVHPYRDLVKPGVRFVQSTIRAIDPVARRVETDDGTFEGDIMVVALGADLDPSATPGLVEGGHEFYTVPGAFALRDVLADFDGGRVIVGVTSTPFKCPPAPSETALLVHDFLTERGLRDRLRDLAAHAAAGADPAVAGRRRRRSSPRSPSATSSGARTCWSAVSTRPARSRCSPTAARSPTTCSSACRSTTRPRWSRSRACASTAGSRSIRARSQTSFPGVYAVGDVTSVGTPKAGVFAEGQAAVVAAAIIAGQAGAASPVEYDGSGKCYLEFGRAGVARVEVTFMPGQAPSGTFEPASAEGAALKAEFGTTRIRRWFGRDWSG